MMDAATFNQQYKDWSTTNYWEAVIESQKVAVLGEQVYVYGTTAKGKTRWYLALRPDGDRRQ